MKKVWQVCMGLNYEISERGSMAELSRMVRNKAIKVWLMSGDWDDIVPYSDTEKNIPGLGTYTVG